MARRILSRFIPPQEDEEEEEEEEEENESDTDSEDDTSSSDADTESEVAVNLPQRLRQLRDSAIEVGEETEDEEEGSEGEQEEEIKGKVKNGEEKGREDVGIELGNNSVLPTCPVCMEPWTSEGPHRVWYRHFFFEFENKE